MRPVIIGSGLAGLSVALALAPQPVIVLAAKKLGEECSSTWAQGGIAAAVGADDNAALHAADTLVAGAGLCDADIVRQVTDDGALVIEKLSTYGAQFDRDAQGKLKTGLEAAHGQKRIVHAKGDGTGREVMRAMVAAARATPSIEIIENAVATDIIVEDGVTGIAVNRDGESFVIATNQVVLATGGAGALWCHTTNPIGSWGSGLALAARAGAVLGDLEFMQFHPTAIDVGRDPMPLASEALRGDGATLIDETGTRFMTAGQAELSPRDVVAATIWQHRLAGHHVFLDARCFGAGFAQRFPAVHALCIAGGIDPVTQPIPVRPAAHYYMGGIVTDMQGRSTIEGLWACGEAANTGLHGANRLASNSLLEAVSFGQRVAADIATSQTNRQLKRKTYRSHLASEAVETVRDIVSAHLGVTRNAAGLQQAINSLQPLANVSDRALVGLMMATSALQREESRGAHRRTDFPETKQSWQKRQELTLTDVLPYNENEKVRA